MHLVQELRRQDLLDDLRRFTLVRDLFQASL